MVRDRNRPIVPALLVIVLLLLAGCSTTSYELGRSRLADGDPEAAVAAFDAAIEADQLVFESTRERGAAHLEMGRVAAAITDLEAAATMRGDDLRLLWLLGRTYSKAERYSDAAQAYRAYFDRSRSRDAKAYARQRVAQLEHEFDREVAREIVLARGSGRAPAPNSLAVYSFRANGGESASLEDQKICRALNIWVSADLAKVSGVQSVALDQLQAIYEEQRLGYDQVRAADPKSAVSMGNVQPARHMVQGLFGRLEDERIVMGASCYDVTADETNSCSARDGLMANLFDLETDFVLDVLASIGVTPTPEELKAIGVKPTRNLQAFLAFSDGVYLRDIGQYEAAIDAFAAAAALDPGFEMANMQAAATQVAQSPNVSVVVPAPPAPQTQSARAQRSAQFLGFGITPESGEGEEGAETSDLITVRGEATLSIRGRAGGRE